MSCKVAFIGLGVMGYPMAGYISKAGHNVTVYNRTKSKADKWIKEYEGKTADTPMEAATDCDFIFTCVGNDNDLREVTLGDKGLFKSAKKNSIYIIDFRKKIKQEYIDEAVKNGSVAIVSNKYLKSCRLPQFIVNDLNKNLLNILKTLKTFPPKNMIGITGTNGKTSVVWNIKDLILLSSRKVNSYGTLGFYKNKNKVEDSILTTPEFEILYQTFLMWIFY